MWLLLLIGMILHFNYHVSKIFYGIEVVRPGASGVIPVMAHVMKSVFYHFPMIFIVALLYLRQNWFRLAMILISLVYSASHIMHVLDEFKKPHLDWAQIPLLSLVLIINLFLNKAAWDYFKKDKIVPAREVKL